MIYFDIRNIVIWDTCRLGIGHILCEEINCIFAALAVEIPLFVINELMKDVVWNILRKIQFWLVSKKTQKFKKTCIPHLCPMIMFLCLLL